MKQYVSKAIGILTALLVLSGCNFDSQHAPPLITAQGFAISETQAGVVSKFGNLRLRIECAGRIQELHIKERSYEVDLATTPEHKHFPLFGLDKPAHLRTDITLDFQNYINQKLDQEGDYEFEITVKDKQGQSTNASLKIHLTKEKTAATPIETGKFQLQREAKCDVKSNAPFGITWLTIDAKKVTIRVKKCDGGASKLANFTADDYRRLASKEQLVEWLAAAQGLESIEFDTSSNAAKEQVIGITNLGQHFLLRILNSNTSLSRIGTTVVLIGEYKY